MPISRKDAIKRLGEAFSHKKLTLYIGAGVSIGNNLPSWDKLVLAMYFNKISEQELKGWRPFSNYLFAISEWYLSTSAEPLEITARKLQIYYKSLDWETEFLVDLHKTLYGSYLDRNGEIAGPIDGSGLRHHNATLDAVATLCESSKSGIKSIITYNYDNFLEIALGQCAHQPIYSAKKLEKEALPIYHVHGFVPVDSNAKGSSGGDIVFTEDQYHSVARNPYHWTNLVQLQAMTDNVSLMIGLSLTDRNLRRLLDAVSNAPVDSTNFAILMEPDTTTPDGRTLDDIHENAKRYLEKFEHSGVKSDVDQYEAVLFSKPGTKSEALNLDSFSGVKGPRYHYEIAGIIEQVKLQGKDQQEFILEQMGVHPIWIKDFSEIPGILEQINPISNSQN